MMWNKPTYLDATILELSKLQLYTFHYEEKVPLCGQPSRVLNKD